MLVEGSIIIGAVLAGGAALQHFYDRYSRNGLYGRTLRTSAEGLKALQSELQGLRATFAGNPSLATVNELGELPRILQELPIKVGDEVKRAFVDAQRALTEELSKPFEGTARPEVQTMGTDAASLKALTRSLKSAVGVDMIGPYAGILQEWAPNIYAWLREHPESVQWALEQTFIQSIIQRVVKASPSPTSGSGQAWLPTPEWERR